ncbi:HAMP domain-containing sensor histidine kinase [Sphingomonas sp.]|uniref:sensor histidine kinase n=1 Tax=Sphingomonas sp. TaxID=28214 RepID=UPI001B10EE43|nr:HAMP domain-containing sensor histidine kinase [Sphingomonas sp.]MBO9712881.1 HAMP domain-containing histidine kinase [Sphingomonas sp.]
MMRLTGSFSFRVVLIQLGVFVTAVTVLLGLFYWLAHIRPTAEVQQSIMAEHAQLTRLYNEHGIDALRQALEHRAAAKSRRQAYHMLADAQGHVVTANLPSWPRVARDQWLRLDADVYRDGVEDDHEALSLDQPLPGGARLLVGRDVEDLDRIERAVRRALVYGLPALLLLVIGAGALSSRAIGKRIEVMSETARRVMEGDLSERVPLRARDDDFNQLARTLNAMLDRIEASLESVRRVSDSVAHELRTPLARLQAELAELHDAPPERIPKLAEDAAEEAARVARMADAVLRISRIEAGRHRGDMRRVDLSELLIDAADYHAPLAESRNQRLETDIAAGLSVRGDTDLIFQAVSNLLDNAIKFTPAGGRVTLAAEPRGGAVVVSVTDTGPGIPSELRAKTGERFFRAPEAEAVPGFGLGLALVNAVATMHESALTLADASPGLRVEWKLARAG